MRFKALLLVAVAGALALPATAQSYRDPCRDQRGDNQAAGLILGGILGGVLGSNVAASGHRHDGTALGAVLGGVVGSQIGRGSANCDNGRYGSSTPYASYPSTQYGQPYGYSGYPSYPSAYGTSPGYARTPDYGYYPEPDYRDRDYGYGDGYRDQKPHQKRDYAYDNRDYIGDDYAGRDCSDATQITRLPDGTEIRRTVDACRDSYYGGWKIED